MVTCKPDREIYRIVHIYLSHKISVNQKEMQIMDVVISQFLGTTFGCKIIIPMQKSVL